MTVKDVLIKAKSKTVDPQDANPSMGVYCASNAIIKAAGDIDYPLNKEAKQLLAEAIDPNTTDKFVTIWNWFDDPHRTYSEVVSKFDEAIAKAESSSRYVEVDWDGPADLPTVVLVPLMEDEDVADWLSDEYGWCVNGWVYKDS